eukprot:g1395.t1
MADELSKEEEKTDWYGVLAVDVSATEKDINKSFKKLSLVWHPDKNGGSEEAHAKFMKIKEAKLFLLDGKKRKLYDQRRAARLKTEALLAERNRTMGKRQRELRAELERREKEAASGGTFSSPSGRGGRAGGGGGLGAGGEARVAAAKLDELRKKGEAERQRQSADWSVKSASAKKRSARSSGLPGAGGGDDEEDGDGLEQRTIRVKWKAKKESHSDYTLDVLFSRFGVVQSVSIEDGKGDRALVVFASAASADAAMAAYGDRDSGEAVTMRTSYVGKRRPKRSAFAPRRQTMSPHTPASASEGESLRSFRDHESVVMMNLRKEGERQALIRKMAEEEGLPVSSGGGKNAAASPTPGRAGAAAAAAGAGTGAKAVAAARTGAAAEVASRATGGTSGVEGGRDSSGEESPGGRGNPGKGDPSKAGEKGDGGAAAAAAAGTAATPTPAARNGGPAPSRSAGAGGGAAREAKPVFPIPSPMTSRVMPAPSDLSSRRKSDAALPAMMGGGGGGSRLGGFAPATPAVSAFGIGSKSMPTTPVSGRGAAGQTLDESDILARMMAMKR